MNSNPETVSEFEGGTLFWDEIAGLAENVAKGVAYEKSNDS